MLALPKIVYVSGNIHYRNHIKVNTLVYPAFGSLNAERDILTELLADKRSRNTRHAYERDLKDFFASVSGESFNPEIVHKFLQLNRFNVIALVLKYKANLIDRNLKEATVNRRLAAIKALVNHARKLGLVDWSLEDVKGEKVVPYRDTTGISPEAFTQMLKIPH